VPCGLWTSPCCVGNLWWYNIYASFIRNLLNDTGLESLIIHACLESLFIHAGSFDIFRFLMSPFPCSCSCLCTSYPHPSWPTAWGHQGLGKGDKQLAHWQTHDGLGCRTLLPVENCALCQQRLEGPYWIIGHHRHPQHFVPRNASCCHQRGAYRYFYALDYSQRTGEDRLAVCWIVKQRESFLDKVTTMTLKLWAEDLASVAETKEERRLNHNVLRGEWDVVRWHWNLVFKPTLPVLWHLMGEILGWGSHCGYREEEDRRGT